MPNAPVIQTFNAQVGLNKEVTPGTYVAPAAARDFLFATSWKLEEIISDHPDLSYQGISAKESGLYPGFRYAKVTIDTYLTQLPIGHFFKAALGSETLTGAADPYTHAFAALNTGAAPSYSIALYDGGVQATARAITNAYLLDLSLSYAHGQADGLIKVTATFIGKYEVSQTKPTAIYDTAPHYIAYQNALTLATVSNGKLIAFDMKIARETEPIYGSTGTQDISAVSQGRMLVSGKLTFAPTDATEINYYLNNTQPVFSALFTNTASHTLNVVMSKCAFSNGTVLDFGSPYVKVVANYKGIYNATDAGPCKITLLNASSTAY